MPVLDIPLDDIRAARQALAQQRDAQRAASAALLQAQRRLADLAASGANADQIAAQQAQVDAMRARVREGAAGAREGVAALRALSDDLLANQPDPATLVQALSAQQPVLLMPVAVQTRYAKDLSQLMVRIYPDALHQFAHEPGLTPAEVDAGKHYWQLRFATPDDSTSPWTEIARRYRPARAAWIVRQTTPTNLAALGQAADGGLVAPEFDDASIVLADPKAQAIYAAALPDRFVAIGLRGGVEIFRKWGAAVPELLPMSPAFDPEQADAPPPDSPQDYDPFGADLAWMIDFDQAVAVGMGIRITAADLKAGAQMGSGVDRLIVLGVDWTQTPESAGELISELLDNHQHGDGLKFVAQGTPTNNTASTRSGYAQGGGDVAAALDPTATAARSAAVADELASAGARLQQLLGLPAELFDAGQIPGADLQEAAAAGHMLNALWKATLGYTLRYFWNPIDSTQSLIADDAIEQLRAWSVRYLRASGPLSALRVGKQPYGILPVTARAYMARADSPLERELAQALGWFRSFWDAAVPGVPTLQDPSAESLHQVLAMQPWACAKRFWQVAGPAAVQNYPDIDVFASLQSKLYALCLEGLLAGQPPFAQVPFVATCAVRPKPYPLDAVPWVQRDPANPSVELTGDAPLATNFIAQLLTILTTPTSDLRAQIVAMQNAESLLEAMLAFAADEEVLHSSQSLFYQHLLSIPNLSADIRQRAQRLRAAEYVGVDSVSLVGDQFALGHAKAVLGLKLGGTTGNLTVEEAIGAKLSAVAANFPEHMSNIASFNDSLAALQDRLAGELSLAFRTTLDLFSTRLDAWITSLATRRLEQMRETAPAGLHIGAFGIVEKLVPDAQQHGDQALDSLGYVHAPSIQQAATAAILRSGHVANRDSDADAFNIDLRSRRVKRARRLLEGLANEQAMAALVGYRFERALRDANLSQDILDYRKQFPLKPAGASYDDQPQEAIAARDVVDGVRLIDTYRSGGMAAVRPPTVPPSDDAATQAILDDLLDQMDAVADLLLAESVFQMAGGNLEGASAAMTALDKQERPPETRVADTPHSTRGYTQRVVVALASIDAGPWPADDLSARLEPRLNAWLARLMGDPARYRFYARVLRKTVVANPPPAAPTVSWTDDGETIEVSLAELDLSPLALVLGSEAQQGSGQSAVQEHLATSLGAKAHERFGAAADAMALVLEGAAPVDAPAGSVGLVAFESFAWLLRRLLAKARPLRRLDLVLARDGVESQALADDGEFAGVDLADLKARLQIADDAATQVLDALQAALPPPAMDLDAVAALDPNAPASVAMFNAIQGALAQAYALGWRSALASTAVAETGRNDQGEQVLPDDSLLLAVARGRALLAEVSARRDAAPAPTALDAGGQPVPTARQAQLALARVAAIVGKDFPLLPRFTLGDYAAPAVATLGDRATLLGMADLGNDDAAIAGWLPKLGCVREVTGLLSDALTAAEALGASTGYEGAASDFKLLQFPRDGTAHWAALPPKPGQVLRGVVAVVAHAPGALEGIGAQDRLSGLFIDEWSESIPSAQETTGLSFHFDAPGARPPQSLLLAVPADPQADAWTLDALLATVNEAIELAKLRTVRPQDLSGLGLILPGIYLSNNYQRDVPSVDFSRMVARNLAALRADAQISSAGALAVMAAGKSVVSG